MAAAAGIIGHQAGRIAIGPHEVVAYRHCMRSIYAHACRTAHFRSYRPCELRNFILGLGPWVKVVKPPALRKEVSKQAGGMAALYNGRGRCPTHFCPGRLVASALPIARRR